MILSKQLLVGCPKGKKCFAANSVTGAYVLTYIFHYALNYDYNSSEFVGCNSNSSEKNKHLLSCVTNEHAGIINAFTLIQL